MEASSLGRARAHTCGSRFASSARRTAVRPSPASMMGPGLRRWHGTRAGVRISVGAGISRGDGVGRIKRHEPHLRHGRGCRSSPRSCGLVRLLPDLVAAARRTESLSSALAPWELDPHPDGEGRSNLAIAAWLGSSLANKARVSRPPLPRDVTGGWFVAVFRERSPATHRPRSRTRRPATGSAGGASPLGGRRCRRLETAASGR